MMTLKTNPIRQALFYALYGMTCWSGSFSALNAQTGTPNISPYHMYMEHGHPTRETVYNIDTLGTASVTFITDFEYKDGKIFSASNKVTFSNYRYEYFHTGDHITRILTSVAYNPSPMYLYVRRRDFVYDNEDRYVAQYEYMGQSGSQIPQYLIFSDMPGGELIKNEKGQTIRWNHYEMIQSCRYDLFASGYDEYKYKNDVIDSIITYDIYHHCSNRERKDTTLLRVVSNIKSFEHYDDRHVENLKLGSYKLFDTYHNSTEYIVKDSDTQGRLLFEARLNEDGDTTNKVNHYYDGDAHILTSSFSDLGKKIVESFDHANRRIKYEVFNLKNSQWKISSSERYEYVNDSIRAVQKETYTASGKASGTKWLYEYSIPTSIHEPILQDEGLFAPNPSSGNITLRHVNELAQLSITSHEGKTEHLPVSEHIQLDKAAGIYLLTFTYKDGSVKRTKLALN